MVYEGFEPPTFGVSCRCSTPELIDRGGTSRGRTESFRASTGRYNRVSLGTVEPEPGIEPE